MPGAVTFASRESLLKTSTVSPPGTFAYLIDEEAILVKVTNGWKYIMVSKIGLNVKALLLQSMNSALFSDEQLGNFIGGAPQQQPPAPSTVAPEPSNLFAAKLLNHVPQVIDGPSVST